MVQQWKLRAWFFLAIGVWALTGCATNPVSGGRDFVLVSEQEELALGRAAHAQIVQQFGVYDDPELAAYVERIGQELAASSHRAGIDYHFTVLDSPTVNAFALPGGYIYVTRGILSYLNSEAQLAGVLGHEIGHVTARHGVRQQSVDTATKVASELAGVVAQILTGSAVVGDLANSAIDVGGSVWVNGYGREQELEADRLGAEYLARTGYDPDEMIGVIEVLKDQEEFARESEPEGGRVAATYHGLFATHPSNDKRLQEVVKAARQYAGPVSRSANAADYLKQLDGLVFGDSTEQGVVRDAVFYHAPLGIRIGFPADWTIENRPEQVVAIAPDQQQIISVELQSRDGAPTPADYLASRLGTLRGGRSHGHADLAGYSADAAIRVANGTVPARVAVVFDDDRAYLFTAAGRQGAPVQALDTTLAQFQRLTDEEKWSISPLQIGIVQTEPGDDIATLAATLPVQKRPEAQLRLLNGLYPTGEPMTGQLLKVLR